MGGSGAAVSGRVGWVSGVQAGVTKMCFKVLAKKQPCVGPMLLDRTCLFFGYVCSGPRTHINMKECFYETGFDVLPAIPGRRPTIHDGYPTGFARLC